jgi:hypothetical protein
MKFNSRTIDVKMFSNAQTCFVIVDLLSLLNNQQTNIKKSLQANWKNLVINLLVFLLKRKIASHQQKHLFTINLRRKIVQNKAKLTQCNCRQAKPTVRYEMSRK